MYKFTPAPWTVSTKKGSVGAIRHSVGFVAFPCAPREVDDSRLDGESWLSMHNRTEPMREAVVVEQEANARLIAAAPELLEALIDLLKYGMEGDKVRAVATIKKATGGAA